MAEGMRLEYGFWRLVMDKGLPPETVDAMDLEDIDKANAYLDMAEDYKSAFHELYDERSRQKAENAQ